MTLTATFHTPHRYSSLGTGDACIPDLLAANAVTRGGDLLVIDGDVRMSVGDVVREASRWQSLLRRHGVGAGDVVMVQLPNRWETIAILHAVWALGAVANPVTPIYRGHELRVLLTLGDPRVIITADRSAASARAVVAELHTTSPPVVIDLAAAELLDASVPLERTSATLDTVAMLMYTSGTTGRPKGVLHTHRTLISESASIDAVFGLTGQRVFMPSPLTHITGLLYGVILPLLTHSAVVLQDRWNPDTAVELIEREGCGVSVGATPFLRGLSDASEARGHHARLRVFVCGGADIPATLVEAAESTMGSQIARTYGSTEIPTLCTVHPNTERAERLGTDGHVIGEARARLSGVIDGVGSLEVHGPELFVGYANPADNASAFTEDGWFRTGDLARIDDSGAISIVGREKDIIVRGGENLSAKEIEDLLAQHPDIDDVAVVALRDDLMGERACAVVVASAPIELADLVRHLATFDLAVQKYPEALLITGALPRTPSGKVQKHLLRERVATSPFVEIRSKPGRTSR